MPGDHLVLLARDVDGYTALSRLASRGHLAGEKQFPVFERSLVAAALDEARGHLVRPLRLPQRRRCRGSCWPATRAAALHAARTWAGHFADGDFAIELSHHLRPDDDWLVAQLAELAARAGLPTAVTNEVHYADPGGHRLQDVLVCIRHGATLDEARELLLPNAEYRLKTGAELAAIGAGLPDARSRHAWEEGMARSAAIGEACRLELGFERYRFPGFTVPKGETAFSYLYQLAHDGLLRRYRPVTKRALRQLTHELDIIERTEPRRVLPDRVGPDGVRADGRRSSARDGGAPATRSWPTAWASPRSTRSSTSSSSSASSTRRARCRTSTSTSTSTGARR